MADTIHAHLTAPVFQTPTRRAERPSYRALFGLWRFRWESRRALAQLDAAQLADIGVRAEDAAIEAAKPFWRP